MSIIVFTGPSLSHIDAKKILPKANYHEPIQCGDIVKAMRIGAKKIVIIDGYFEQKGAVWHKEILFALSHGVMVYGASSMGALRAAECHPFGMIGHGKIFEMYRDNITLDDDEVALVHDDRYDSIITPMVNIRATLTHALELNKIDSETEQRLLAQLKHKPYYSRSLFNASDDTELNQWLKDNYVDQKRIDAIDLLINIKENSLSSPYITEPSPSIFFDKIFREKIVEPFDKAYSWLSPEEQNDANMPTSSNRQNLTRIAKCCHLSLDIAVKNQQVIKTDETFLHLKALAADAPIDQKTMLAHLLIEAGIEGSPTEPEEKILNTLAFALRGLIAYMHQNQLAISARFAQRYADEFRRTRKLTSVEATFEWMDKNNLKDQTAFENLINALAPMHHIIDLHNSHSIGLKTSHLCYDWLNLANQTALHTTAIEATKETLCE